MLPIQFYIDQWTQLPPIDEGCSLAGKTVILTGATSGIGLEAAFQLAALSPERLIITARSAKTGAPALEEILRRHPGTNMDCWDLNMSDCTTLSGALESTGFDPKRKMETTIDGNDNVTQTNVLSTILIALLLQPLLVKSAQPRIVFTTSDTATRADHKYISEAARRGNILETFNDKQHYTNPTRYFQTKLLLQLVLRHLIPALPGINIISTNPGLCYSRLNRNTVFPWTFAGLQLRAWYRFTARPAVVGARTIVWSAVEAPHESCEYSAQCRFESFASPFLSTLTGMQVAAQLYREVKEALEKVSPGCTECLA